MAPLDDLVHTILVAFEDGFHGSVPTVSDPTFEAQLGGQLLGMMAEEHPLNASLNDDPGPHLFHVALEITIRPS